MNTYLKYLFAGITIVLLACSVHSQSTTSAAPATLKVDYVDGLVKTDDGLTRIQVRLLGRPHTSERIDSVYILGIDSVPVAATDIDGVDFGRWFQWEDEPSIDVEIDFPGTAYSGEETLLFFSPRGNVKCNIAPLK